MDEHCLKLHKFYYSKKGITDIISSLYDKVCRYLFFIKFACNITHIITITHRWRLIHWAWIIVWSYHTP